MYHNNTVGVRTLGLIWFLLAAIGCPTTTQMVSNRDPALAAKLRRVYAVAYLSRRDTTLGERFPKEITQAFSQRGVTCTVVTVNEVELDTSRYTSEIDAAAAEAVLILEPVQWRSRVEDGRPV